MVRALRPVGAAGFSQKYVSIPVLPGDWKFAPKSAVRGTLPGHFSAAFRGYQSCVCVCARARARARKRCAAPCLEILSPSFMISIMACPSRPHLTTLANSSAKQPRGRQGPTCRRILSSSAASACCTSDDACPSSSPQRHKYPTRDQRSRAALEAHAASVAHCHAKSGTPQGAVLSGWPAPAGPGGNAARRCAASVSPRLRGDAPRRRTGPCPGQRASRRCWARPRSPRRATRRMPCDGPGALSMAGWGCPS